MSWRTQRVQCGDCPMWFRSLKTMQTHRREKHATVAWFVLAEDKRKFLANRLIRNSMLKLAAWTGMRWLDIVLPGEHSHDE